MKSSFIAILASMSLLSPCISSAQSNDIAPALRQTLDTAHADWKNDGGSEFKSGLTYVKGVPFLMVISTPGEDAGKTARRKRSIVAACEFLLDEGSFSKAVICVVEVDSKNPTTQKTFNYEVRRGNYQEALKKAANVTDIKEAGKKAKETESIVESVCTALGIK